MTANDPTHERGDEVEAQRITDDGWHEQKDVQVTVLSGDEEESESPGRVRVLEPENEDETTVALSIESAAEDCMARIDVNEALLLADELELVAERVAFEEGDTP